MAARAAKGAETGAGAVTGDQGGAQGLAPGEYFMVLSF